jgi:hypothetical protein
MEPAGEEGKVGGEEQGCKSSNSALHLVSVGFNYLFELSSKALNRSIAIIARHRDLVTQFNNRRLHLPGAPP